MCKLKYILFSLLFFEASGIAQTTYITDSTYFESISDFYFLKKKSSGEFTYPDTSIMNFQYSLPFYFNGQIGTAQPDYLFSQQDYEIGSRIMQWNVPDILKKNQVNVYRTKGFYAKLDGIAGSKDEQHFRAFFTSPVKSQHQINFYFKRSTNTGFYLNQKASITNLLADYHWFGNKKLSMDANVLLNYVKHQENGGIVKDTLSYSDLFLDKTLIPVSLSNASKKITSNQFEYQINYLLFDDSIHSHALSLSAKAHQWMYQYQDDFPLSGYYQFIFLDTLKTNDSLHSWKLDIPLAYSVRFKKSFGQISYNYQWNKIHLYKDTIMSNHIVKLRLESEFKLFKKFDFKLGRELQYIFTGTQKDNYLIEAYIQSKHKKNTFNLEGVLMRQSPTYQQNFWFSNHFIWYNYFKDILTQQFSATWSFLSQIKISYRVFFIENYIYFSNNYPQSYNSTLNVQQLFFGIDKIFFKHLGIKANYYYQWKSANAVVLPEHFFNGNLYYQGRWFRKNLLVNTGVQLVSTFNYFDTYQYNPALGVYSLDFNSVQAGNYPQVGLYFSGRIKPVNFFIRMDYLLSGVYPQPYYFVPHYMMPDRAFRMGISWMFFD